MLKTLGAHAKASLPLYERSVGFASVQSLWAFISGILALLAPPVAPSLSIPTTIAKGQQPLAQHHVLASLVKGRWLDGKAQALILLLSVCDTPTFFIYQTFLPSRRRDCFTPTNLSIPHNHCKRTIIPRKSPSVLI